MKLKLPSYFKTVYKEEQVARNLLWLGLQKENQSLAKIHHLRGIEIDGEPGLLIIQEHANGRQIYSNPRNLNPKTFIHFDDVLFKPDGFSNIIPTQEGPKVVDARLREDTFNKQKCPQGKCNCNWHDFVKKTANGFNPLPEGYIMPQEIKKAYDPKSNPWISQVEKEAGQMKSKPLRG